MNEKQLAYRFDNVEVDLQTFKVWKEGKALSLEPKAFEVLVFLINHRDRLVEKNELLDAVWKESFVSLNALTRVIAHLRKTIGDDAKEAKYIETAPTRGYRFIAEVQIRAVTSPSALSTPKADILSRDRWPRFRLPSASLVLILIFAGILLIFALIFQTPEQPGLLKTMQITTTPALDIFPAFSPDGGAIAYSSLRNGNYEIFVRQLVPGGREVRITADGEQNLQPTWSPDGKTIAYHSRRHHGIRIVPSMGGVARQLTDFGSSPSWSRNGDLITFQSDAVADISQTAFGAMPPSTIWIVPARGGTPQQITGIGVPSGGHGDPTWSPDGRRIIFVTHDIWLSEIWSVSPGGEDLKRVWQGHGQFFDPAFSPDGKYLYFSTASGNFRLWRLRLSADTGLSLGDPIEIANTGASLARHLTVAPDGKRIAYSSLTMINNIGSVMISQNSYESSGPPTLLTQDTNYRKNQHAFSHDGKTIAYNVWRMGVDKEVWLMSADGSDSRQLTSEPAVVLGWLPQTDQLALVSRSSATTSLSKVDVKTGEQMPIVKDSYVAPMGRLSPDSRQIAFNSRADGTINVWTTPFEGGKPKQLTFDREMMGFPCWSPDSQYLAFEMKRGDDTHIAFVNLDGGTPQQLTFERGQAWPGSWSPDGDKIVFAGLRNGIWNIWWVSRSTKVQKQVTNYTKPNTYVRYPAWSPRNNQIVYEYAETTGNIWILELK